MFDADDTYELRICTLGHVDRYRVGFTVPPGCIRRALNWPVHYCGSRTRALTADEHAAYLIGGEDAVTFVRAT